MAKRIEMCEWLDVKLERTPGCLDNIRFCDEAHFYLDGAVNNHNNIFLGHERPKDISGKHLRAIR